METIAIILFVLLYIGVAICVNISLYKAIKESCESKDWEFMVFLPNDVIGGNFSGASFRCYAFHRLIKRIMI